jgi:hypothetical protein
MGFSQKDLSWQGYFSYNEIKDISASSTAIFVASENALFSKNTMDNQIVTTNTVDGLSGQTISSIYYSTVFNKTLVGYENGLIIVINEADGTMLKVVDIINKQLPANKKKVNHFMEFDDIVYVSCEFGIVQFNLESMLFGDTYFIGDTGAEISVRQTAIHNGFIYAATNNGVRSASVSSKNLNDYKQWRSVATGSWSGVEAFGAELIAVSDSGNLNKYNASTNSFTGFATLSQPTLDTRASGAYLIITTAGSVYVYNRQLSLIRQINNNQIPAYSPVFTCATSIDDIIYIGTKENGLLTTTIATISVFENTTPMGPSKNSVFSLQSTSSNLWLVYGGYSVGYNPYEYIPGRGPTAFGISKFSSSGWLNIPYEEVLGAKALSRITVNPNNEDEVYACSFFSGLLKIENDIPVFLFNQKNSGLESISFLGPSYIDVRINGGVFDKAGNFWVNNSLVKNGLKVFKTDGQWQRFSTDNIIDASEDNSFGRMVIDKNSTKWMATNRDGVIGFNESGSAFKKITVGTDTGNLPASDVRALAVDNRNQLWIGTTKGLRILSNVGSFQTGDQLTTNPVIILEDNLAQELLYEQFITDIAVDGANNKWIGTADSGVFLVSSNGQETKYHFTINNSPLPSNVINDIDINSTTGEVFIATTKGLLSFKGIATKASEDLDSAYIYPNPVRPEYDGTVKIAGLINRANVKITDIAGNLVYEAISEGGTLEWDTTAFGKYKVASGVYMIFISAQDGVETKVKKVMIIR